MTGPHSDHSLPRKTGRHGSRLQRNDSGFVESGSRRHSLDIGRSTLSNTDSQPPNDQSQPPNASSASNFSRRRVSEAPPDPIMKDRSSRRQSEGRRSSVTSTITSTTPSTKPRRSRPSSHKSSRRTLVIHQAGRSKLRGSQTMPPLPTRDVDDVLALHHRSCTLFRSFTAATTPPESYATTSRFSPSNLTSASAVSLALSSTGIKEEEYPHVPPTTIHWTSPSTRRREYAEIDREGRGLRGLLTKIRARWGRASPPVGFWEEDRVGDGGSVRRYRLELPDEEEEEFQKKQDGERAVGRERESKNRPGCKTRWICF